MDDVILDKHTETTPPVVQGRAVKKKRKNSGFLNYLFNFAACCLITISLLGIDFVLFASSGPINIFSGPSSLRPEALYILIAIAAGVVLLFFCLSFLSIILYLLTALVSGLFTLAMFNQFANFNAENLSSGRSETFAAVIVAVIMFALLALTPKRIKALVVMTAVFCFGAVLINQNKDKSEFIVNPDMRSVPALTEEQAPAKKTVTIMVANLPSYNYVSSLKNTDAALVYRDQLLKIMLGFYAKNGFRLYPNAYVTNNNQFINAARSLNYGSGEDIDFLQNQVLKNGYWQFKNRENFEAYLQNNAVYDKLKQEGYKISAYQSHGVNLCKKDNQVAVDRCVTKVNAPLNLDGVPMTAGDKIQILLVQWLESTGWFKNEAMMEKLYGYLKPFYNPSKTPMIGFSYNKLYVVNSFKNIDMMLDDLAEDKGNNAYFVYLDLPSDMYIYDDMCRLKPTAEWLPKLNHPWVDSRNLMEKRNAYLRQTMCLFGQLEKVMQAIRKLPDAADTTVVIEGLAGMDDLIGTPNQDLSERFRNGQLVALAIKTPGNKQLVINRSICPVEEILNNLFENGPKCSEFGRTKLSKTTKKAVKAAVDTVKYTNDNAQKSLQEFNRWFKEWNRINYRTPMKSPLQASDNRNDKGIGQPQTVPASPLMPLEEKNIGSQKIMSGEIKVGAEAKVESLSGTASEGSVAAE